MFHRQHFAILLAVAILHVATAVDQQLSYEARLESEVKALVHLAKLRPPLEITAASAGDAKPSRWEEAAPLRVKLDYRSMERLPAELSAELRTTLVPTVTAELRRLLRQKHPVEGNLTGRPHCEDDEPCSKLDVSDKWCSKSLDVRHHPGLIAKQWKGEVTPPGIPDTDVILYVLAGSEDQCGKASLAYAAPCLLDEDTGRLIVICERLFRDPTDSIIQTLLHEVLHVLFLNHNLFPLFIDDLRRRIGERDVWEYAELQGTGWEGMRITTPNVVTQLRKSTGCDKLTGAPLENNGGPGTHLSHWEARFLMGDLMTGSPLLHQEHVTAVTLALAVDTGWYLADLDSATPLVFGSSVGCDFWRQSCDEVIETHPAQRFLCKPSDSEVSWACSGHGQRAGICLGSMLMGSNSCGTVLSWDWMKSTWDCTAPQTRFAEEVLGVKHQPYASYGESSGCMQVHSQGGSGTGDGRDSARSLASCTGFSCQGNDLFLTLKTNSSAVSVRCLEGSMISLSEHGISSADGTEAQLGPCPNNTAICSSLRECPGGCNGRGFCGTGRCQCIPGWVGDACQEAICLPGGCEASQTCEVASGRCIAKPGHEVSPGISPPSSSPTPETAQSPTDTLAASVSLGVDTAEEQPAVDNGLMAEDLMDLVTEAATEADMLAFLVSSQCANLTFAECETSRDGSGGDAAASIRPAPEAAGEEEVSVLGTSFAARKDLRMEDGSGSSDGGEESNASAAGINLQHGRMGTGYLPAVIITIAATMALLQ